MRALLKLTLLALLAALALPARAQTVYICTIAYTNHSSDSQFGTIDLQTGAFHAIATNKRYENVTALGFGANGKLYALCRDDSSAKPGMDEYSIDTTTGDMTLQKKFVIPELICAGADSKGVFTGFLLDVVVGATRLFTLDPVAQSLQVGAFTLLWPRGLVVADGLGNVYVNDDQPLPFGGEKLAKVINVHTGAAVILGNTRLRDTYTGFLYHGLLYALNIDYYGRPGIVSRIGSDYSRQIGIYTLNPTTGAARLVVRSALPSNFLIKAAALAPIPAVVTNKEPTLIINHLRRNLPPRVK